MVLQAKVFVIFIQHVNFHIPPYSQPHTTRTFVITNVDSG